MMKEIVTMNGTPKRKILERLEGIGKYVQGADTCRELANSKIQLKGEKRHYSRVIYFVVTIVPYMDGAQMICTVFYLCLTPYTVY